MSEAKYGATRGSASTPNPPADIELDGGETIITSSGVVIRSNTEIALNRDSIDSIRQLLQLASDGRMRGFHMKTPVPMQGKPKAQSK